MKAFAYLRVSGKGQVDGDGFTRQWLAIEKHALANNIEIVAVYREMGVTGELDGMDRPAWSAMIADCQDVHMVVIEYLDRLARDLMVQETIVLQARRAGIALVSIAEPDLCSVDPSRVMVRQIMGSVAQYDKAQIVAKLRGARQRKRQVTGESCEGRKPYGHHPNFPAEVETLAKIMAWDADHYSLNAIARRLNDAGIKSRTGGIWFPMVVRRILDRRRSTAAGNS